MKSDILISVIIPVYNGAKSIPSLMTSLFNQENVECNFEIIVVDNNSTDNTKEVVKQFSDVILLSHTAQQSSYAARNEGILASRGKFLAFTDADCVVAPNWIQTIQKKINFFSDAILCGEVEFTFPDRPTPAQIFDAMIFFNVEQAVKRYHYSVTANLIVSRDFFDKYGLFYNHFISGGDVEWTNRLYRKGVHLEYSPEIVVYHKTRDFNELCKKSIRVGMGLSDGWLVMKKSKFGIFLRMLTMLLPKINWSFKKIKKGHFDKSCIRFHYYIYFCFLSWWCNILTLYGFIKAFFNKCDPEID